MAVKILLNAWQIIQYLWLYLFGGPIDLTEKQRQLLGVQNDGKFRVRWGADYILNGKKIKCAFRLKAKF